MIDTKQIGHTINYYKSIDNGQLLLQLQHILGTNVPNELAEAQDFVLTYLGFAEPALEHLLVGVQHSHHLPQVKVIIKSCIDYFKKSNDLISEHQYGLYGLIDDAYRTLKFVCMLKDVITDIQLPFDIEELKKLNNTIRTLLPEDVAQKIDQEVIGKQADLLINEVAQAFQEKKTIEPIPVNFYNGTVGFTFQAYPILIGFTVYKDVKCAYAYTRLVKKDNKSIHEILYISMANDTSAIDQKKHLKVLKKGNPTHICIYTESQMSNVLVNCAKSLVKYYQPPYNKKINQVNATNNQHQTTQFRPQMKNCTTCGGSGSSVCYSCGGNGGRYQSRVDYDWEGRPIYRDEWINCYSCSGGYSTCTTCGGKGEIYS